ncbi:unnamed protein product, partial [Meganyctiphanes norvegica]
MQPINEKHKISSLQTAFKNGYHLIAKKLLENDSSVQLQREWVKEVLENIINGLKKKNNMQCQGINKNENREKQKKKKRGISDEKENKQNYQKCFEILLEPNLNIQDYVIKNDHDLFYKICSNGLTELADFIIDDSADPCREFKGDEKTEKSPIHIASRYGYHKLVDLLLNKMKARGLEKIMQGLQLTNKWKNLAIHNVVRTFAKKDKNEKRKEDLRPEIDYYKCIESLLKYKEYYNIDAQDSQGNTALHYATQLRDDHRFTKLLLMNGSQMTIKNNKHITAKSKISPSLVKEVLDSCIKADGDESVEDDLRITIDLSIFSHKHDSKTKTETELLMTLRDSRQYKHLLDHPVISTFLYIKWQKIKTFWYTNLFFYLLFFSSLIAYIYFIESESNDTTRMLSLKVIITVMSVYMLIREMIQLFIFKLSYFYSFDNLLEISLLIMTGLLLYLPLYLPNSNIQHEFTAWIVIGSMVECILLFGKVPLFQFSIYITMFKKVTFNFLRIIAVLFLWIILAFSFSFFILFKGHHQSLNSKRVDSNSSFITFSKALLKTTVMSTGEIEYTDIPFDSSYPLSSRLLFTIFIFVIVFVTVNLINGIAISDIKKIIKEAENHAIMAEAECIIGINETLRMLIKILNFNCLERIWNYCLIFDDCFSKKSISLFPNRHYVDVWATCEGHKCRLSKYININHCPYYFWLNLWDIYGLLHRLMFVKMCNECKIFYDKRVHAISNHKCEKKYECGICKRYKYIKQSSKLIHVCLHRHRYYIKSISIDAAKNIVKNQKLKTEKKQKEEEKWIRNLKRKQKEDEEKRRDARISQICKEIGEEKQGREQLQTTVNELTEMIKEIKNQNEP